MLVSHRHGFIYIKTVKTAGTSVERALEPFCRDSPDDPAGTETAAGIVGLRGDGVAGARWRHHMPARAIRRELGAKTWRRYLKICNIRNPWDKTVSWFHHRHPALAEAPPDAVIAAFRGWLATTDRLGQDFGKYTLAGRPVADVHIRYGALDSDFAALCARLGLGEVALGRYKTGARGAERTDYRAYYDAEARARVASAFAPDIAAFGWRFDDEMPGSLPEQGKDG